MIRVFLVDDQTLVRQGVRSLLELSDSVQVIGEARDGDEAIAEMTSGVPTACMTEPSRQFAQRMLQYARDHLIHGASVK